MCFVEAIERVCFVLVEFLNVEFPWKCWLWWLC